MSTWRQGFVCKGFNAERLPGEIYNEGRKQVKKGRRSRATESRCLTLKFFLHGSSGIELYLRTCSLLTRLLRFHNLCLSALANGDL
jgi:hypothetical protein